MYSLTRSFAVLFALLAVSFSAPAYAKSFIAAFTQTNSSSSAQEVSCKDDNNPCYLKLSVLTNNHQIKPILIKVRSVPGEIYFWFKSSEGYLYVGYEDYFRIVVGEPMNAEDKVELYLPPPSSDSGIRQSPVLRYTDEPIATLDILIRPAQ